MLNESQKRSLTITLRMVEESLREILSLLGSQGRKGILFEIVDDLPKRVKEEALQEVCSAVEIVQELVERFELEIRPLSRKAFGNLSYLREILSDSDSKGLRRYGAGMRTCPSGSIPRFRAVIEKITRLEKIFFQKE